MKTWEIVKRIQETAESEAERAKATLLVNYGPEGHTIPDVIAGNETLELMVLRVLEKYEAEIKRRDYLLSYIKRQLELNTGIDSAEQVPKYFLIKLLCFINEEQALSEVKNNE